ncbi:MAG TPA: hypothetical protein VIT91_02395 [Chthoniobacterales bacterium]
MKRSREKLLERWSIWYLTMQEEMMRMRADIGRLQERIAQLEGENRPPSAPFRRREAECKSDPKSPGAAVAIRAVTGKCRKVIDEEIEVPLSRCPHCAGVLEGVIPVVQYIEELPEDRPHVTRLKTYEGHCPRV